MAEKAYAKEQDEGAPAEAKKADDDVIDAEIE